MNTILASVGSKKMMFAGALAALIAQDGWSRVGGPLWFHVIGLSIIGAGYCIGTALQEGLEGHGYDAQAERLKETKTPA